MTSPGSRHRLVLYTSIINRWWLRVLGIGLVLVSLTGGLYYLPVATYPDGMQSVSESILWVLGGSGVFAILMAVFLVLIRKMAYVRPYSNHLRLVTPFFRLKISYRRIRQTSTVEMPDLFHLEQYKGLKRTILRPLMKYTAVVLDLNGLPLSRQALHLFLSPLFFPDNSPRLALLVPDWIKFSTDLESYRSAWQDAQKQSDYDPRTAVLANISNSKH